MTYDAFISYRRENGFGLALVIKEKLEKLGLFCYLDLEKDKAGKFDEGLVAAINDSNNFILVLTKNSLDRCKNDGDWVSREIIAATRANKRIIPVWNDDFEWPSNKQHDFPDEVQKLEKEQNVLVSKEYFSSVIMKIVDYMIDVKTEIRRKHIENYSFLSNIGATRTFFRYAIDLGHISSMDFAFHAGQEWRQETEKIETLRYAIMNNIPIRIILNSSVAVSEICKSMTQPLKKYKTFEECITDWQELERDYPAIFKIAVSDLPLLHRTYLIHFDDGNALANVKYYTYGNYIIEKDYRNVFEKINNKHYQIYEDEFELLWKNYHNK